MAYRIAAVDVHKEMLAVVVADIEGEGEYQLERRKFGATGDQLPLLAQWLSQREVEEVVMEWTAQYWNRCGERWSGTGSRHARSAQELPVSRACCTCARLNPTADRGGERTISPTANG